MQRVFAICLLVAACAFPLVTHAQTTDPRCFTKSECLEARRNVGVDERDAAAGFYSSADNNDALAACGAQDFRGEEMGFCLPSTVARTQITIGGTNEFQNMGEFIELFYQYGIALIGIFSVIMIIIAGAQWITSGGSPDKVGAAKKRIGGAVIGLVLAVFSYTILNTISPNLLRFRLPQVWMVNTFETTANFCGDLVESPNQAATDQPDLALATRKIGPSTPSVQVNQILTEAFDKEREGSKVRKPDAQDLGCGPEYYVEGTGGQTCIANRCPNTGEICVQGVDPAAPEAYSCTPGDIVVKIKNSSPGADSNSAAVAAVITGGWDWGATLGNNGWVASQLDLSPVFNLLCAGGKVHTVTDSFRNISDDATQIQTIIFSKPTAHKTSNPSTNRQNVLNFIQNKCGGTDSNTFLGFYFELEFNEAGRPTHEEHAIGKGGGNSGVDLGASKAITDGTFDTKLKANQITPNQLFSLDDYIDIFGINVTIDAATVRDE